MKFSPKTKNFLLLTCKNSLLIFVSFICFFFLKPRLFSLLSYANTLLCNAENNCPEKIQLFRNFCNEKSLRMERAENRVSNIENKTHKIKEHLDDTEHETVLEAEQELQESQRALTALRTLSTQTVCDENVNTDNITEAQFYHITEILNQENKIIEKTQSSLERILQLCRETKKEANSCCKNPSNCLLSELLGMDSGLDTSTLTGLITALGQGVSLSENQNDHAYKACKALQYTSLFGASVNTGGGAFCLQKAKACIDICSIEPEKSEGLEQQEMEEDISGIVTRTRSLKNLTNSCKQYQKSGWNSGLQGVVLGGVTTFLTHCKQLKEKGVLATNTKLKSVDELWKEHCESNPSNPLCGTCLPSEKAQVKTENSPCPNPPLSLSNGEKNKGKTRENLWESQYAIPEPEGSSQSFSSMEVPQAFIPSPVQENASGSGSAGSRGGGGGGGGVGLGGGGSNSSKPNKGGKGKAKKKGYDTDILGGTQSRGGGGGYNFASVPTLSGGQSKMRNYRSRKSSTSRKFSLKDFLPNQKKKKKEEKQNRFSHFQNWKRKKSIGSKTNNLFYTHSKRIAILCHKGKINCPLRK